jgi:hypothetical protein
MHSHSFSCATVVCFPLFVLIQKVEQKDQGKRECSAALPASAQQLLRTICKCILFTAFLACAYLTINL